MLKRHLPRVICHKAYTYTKRNAVNEGIHEKIVSGKDASFQAWGDATPSPLSLYVP